MRCKNCAHWGKPSKFENLASCNSGKLVEDPYHDSNDQAVYCYYEGGSIDTGPEFGCIHFKERLENETI